MPTTTLNTALPGFARHIGAYIGQFATTTDIAASTALISTDITNLTEDDDVYSDAYARILGTNNDDVRRRVNDHTGATGALDLLGTNLTAESGSVNFQLYRYDPDQLQDALNDAVAAVFPSVYQVVYDRTLYGVLAQREYARPSSIQPGYVRKIWVEKRLDANSFGDNIVKDLDCDFEGALTDWTTSNITLTAEAETNEPDNLMVFAGDQSGKMVVTASNVGTAYLSANNPTNYDGEELNVTVWVYCRTASRVSAAISVDSGTAVTGTTHSGGGWERLSVSTNLGAVSSTIEVGLHATSGTAITFYADELIATAGRTEPPRPYSDSLPYWEERGDNIYIPYTIGTGDQILVEGMGLLSTMTSGTDTIEINGPQLDRLYDYAALEFFEGPEIDQFDDEEQRIALRKLTHFRNKINSGQGYKASKSRRKVPTY